MHLRPAIFGWAAFPVLVSGAFLAALVVVGLPARVTADETPTTGDHSNSASSGDMRTLVRQLGDDLFATRENATTQLIQKGISAKPQLVVALDSSDAEVRQRARRILNVVLEEDLQKRLHAFAADVDGVHQTTLPGWAVFKEAIGSDPVARQLFIEMQTTEWALLEALEESPKHASEQLKLRAQTVMEGMMSAQVRRSSRPQPVTLGSTLALLYVAADPKVSLDNETISNIVKLPLSSTAFLQVVQRVSPQPTAGAEKSRTEMCLRILGRWIERDIDPNFVLQNLEYADQYGLKEGAKPALKIVQAATPGVAAPNNQAIVPVIQPGRAGNLPLAMARPVPTSIATTARALCVLSKVGSKEQLPAIQPFLTDNQECYSIGPNQPMQTQLRDVALLATVQISGQNPKEFGFDRWIPMNHAKLNMQTIAFRSEQDREAAFKKWQDWQAGQKQASGDEKKPKSS